MDSLPSLTDQLGFSHQPTLHHVQAMQRRVGLSFSSKNLFYLRKCWALILMIVVDLSLPVQQAVCHVMSPLSSTKPWIIWQWEMATTELPDKAQTLLYGTREEKETAAGESTTMKIVPLLRSVRSTVAIDTPRPFFLFGECCWCDTLSQPPVTGQIRRKSMELRKRIRFRRGIVIKEREPAKKGHTKVYFSVTSNLVSIKTKAKR